MGTNPTQSANANNIISREKEAQDQADDKYFGREKLYSMTLETFLFNKQMQSFKDNTNKINKNFAGILLDLVETIESFLQTAEVEEPPPSDEEEKMRDVNLIIPTIETAILQVHRSYYCKVCNQAVTKSSSKSINQHFFGMKHLKNLRAYTAKLEEHNRNPKPQSTHQNNLSSTDGSTQSLNIIQGESANNENNRPVQKQRLISLPARVREIAPIKKLPKKLREFVTNINLTNFTTNLIRDGQKIAEQSKHMRVCELLRRKLVNKYPSVKVYSFGSYAIGLGHDRADLDIFVDTENCFYGKLTKRKMKDAIFNVQRILLSSPDQWRDFLPVIKARTPILRTFCVAEKVDCDLSFSNGLSTCNTALIDFLINLQPICKRLALFVKFWSAQLNFSGMNSYCITLMVIFYLQHEKVLPPIKMLQDHSKAVFIDGWNTGFSTPNLTQLKIPLITNFPQYLIGFFKFYGEHFDFTNYIICVLTGTRVPKHIFDHGKETQLPPVFAPFVAYMSKIDLDEADEVEDLFANHKPLVVQDPFELIHNVGKGFAEGNLMKMIHYMRCTNDILMNAHF